MEFRELAVDIHNNNVAKGFWDEPNPNFGEKIALIHSEASEALEYYRKGNPNDDHIPTMNGAVVELADVVIRCMDLAQKHRWDLWGAILAKHAYNVTRPYKHGKKF